MDLARWVYRRDSDSVPLTMPPGQSQRGIVAKRAAYNASLWMTLFGPPRVVSLHNLDRVGGIVDYVDARYSVPDELLREPNTMHADVVREPLRPEIHAVRELAVPVPLTAE